jgi:hypothetical protein
METYLIAYPEMSMDLSLAILKAFINPMVDWVLPLYFIQQLSK